MDSEGSLAVGTEIGCYRIEGVLGEGGMGIVYRALDTRLKRPAAVKVLAEEIASAAARRRFQREAEAASSLNHPHSRMARCSTARRAAPFGCNLPSAARRLV